METSLQQDEPSQIHLLIESEFPFSFHECSNFIRNVFDMQNSHFYTSITVRELRAIFLIHFFFE
jgi:hypothetical protein